MLSWQIEEFGKPLAQAVRETPQPQGSEVLLRVGACGVCHSDVHLLDGYFLLGDGQKLDLSARHCAAAYPGPRDRRQRRGYRA
jgi:NADPH:quinone reductase-like Zn-dependent oxidoreductase